MRGKMRIKLIILGAIAALGLSYLGISLATEEAPTDQHGEAPSLDCFACHGPHPPRNAEEVNLADFAIPSAHGPGLEPPPVATLSCSQCHEYSAELEELNPNSCRGCHERGGYPVRAALETLIEAGHPDVIPAMEVIPDDCRWCHRDLGGALHRRHLIESPKFLLHFQRGCVRCHLLGEDGEVTVVSQPFD